MVQEQNENEANTLALHPVSDGGAVDTSERTWHKTVASVNLETSDGQANTHIQCYQSTVFI